MKALETFILNELSLECLQKFGEKGRPATVLPLLTAKCPATSGPQGPHALKSQSWMQQKSWQHAKNICYTTASSTTGWTSQQIINNERNQQFKALILHQMKIKSNYLKQH